MEITIKGIIVHNIDNIEILWVSVNEFNYQLIKEKLIFERRKIIDYLKDLQDKKIIKSDRRPKNIKLQKHLNNLCKIKLDIKKSINKITTIFQ